MLKIGDKVTHVDYPQPVGRVVAKQRGNGLVLVLWGNAKSESRYTSKHIPSALRPMQ